MLVGLSPKSAPVEVRERVTFAAEEARQALERFNRRFDNCEAVLLSTCNRTELYAARAVHGHPRVEEMIEFFAEEKQCPRDLLTTHIYEKNDRDVVDHLFTVSTSLDSMVLGETQILGQVREAYDLACRMQTTGTMLNPLFQRAIAVGKQVLHQTALSEGRVSVASVAVDFARRIFDRFSDKIVLSIGAGKMAQLVLQSFHGLKPKRLMVCNRDPSKAGELASRFSGEAVPFEHLSEHLVAADIVVSSTGSSHPILTKQLFEPLLRTRRYRPIFLIDIAMPRDIESAIGELNNVYLYNLDDLQRVTAQTHTQRRDTVDDARQIVTRAVADYAQWHRARELGPLIDQLYQRYHEQAKEELQRTLTKLPNISAAEREHLEELTRRIVNKLLHDPIRALRDADSLHAPAAQYSHALRKLFQLDPPSEKSNNES